MHDNDSLIFGGGIVSAYGSTTLNNVTVTANRNSSAGLGGGLEVFRGTVNVNNSVFAENLSGGGADDFYENTFGGIPATINVSNSFFGTDEQAAFDTNISNINNGGSPGLASLADHGGLVQTRAIQAGSQLIDAGDDALLPTETALGIDVDGDGTIESTAISVDARGTGFDRVRAGRVDIGAFELQNQAPVFTSPTTANVAENTQTVHALTTTDADVPTQTITYRLLGQAPVGDLGPGQSLLIDQSITSRDSSATLLMQSDGNLVVYQGGAPVWSTGTAGQGALAATIQPNGNLMLVDGDGFVFQTNSGSGDNSLARLHLTNEGQLIVLRADGARLWESTLGNFSGGGTVRTPAPLAPEFAKAADTDLFQISGSNQLELVTAPDFENSTDSDGDNVYEVSVLADDGNGGVTPQTIQVTVTNVNEAPNSPRPILPASLKTRKPFTRCRWLIPMATRSRLACYQASEPTRTCLKSSLEISSNSELLPILKIRPTPAVHSELLLVTMFT